MVKQLNNGIDDGPSISLRCLSGKSNPNVSIATIVQLPLTRAPSYPPAHETEGSQCSHQRMRRRAAFLARLPAWPR
jgi:hypothetical protein